MIKFLLMAFVLGLAHAELDGEWFTTAIAADNINKIEPNGPLRIYIRKLTCNERCREMKVTFYENLNNQCSKRTVTAYKQADGSFKAKYNGDNRFKAVVATEKTLVFVSKNVDSNGLKTHLIFVLGKGNPLSPEQHSELVKFAKERNIQPENIQDVLATDTCPK